MSAQIRLLYSYISEAVWRRQSICSNRILPAGGSLAKIEHKGTIFWYKRYYQDGQHSEYLGKDNEIADKLKLERDLLERDKVISNYILSMRNMGFPMPPIFTQKTMRALFRAGFFNLDGILRIGDGILNSYGAYYGDIWLARKSNERMLRHKSIEFFVPPESMRRAKKILRANSDLPVKIHEMPDNLADYSEPQVFLCVPGLPVMVPHPESFLDLKLSTNKFGILEQRLQNHIR